MDDTADDAPIIDPLLASRIRRQKGFELGEWLVRQPKQVSAHGSAPFEAMNHNPSQSANSFMGLGPSTTVVDISLFL
jgi:hypothetical protein